LSKKSVQTPEPVKKKAFYLGPLNRILIAYIPEWNYMKLFGSIDTQKSRPNQSLRQNKYHKRLQYHGNSQKDIEQTVKKNIGTQRT
jgi:hypothetical protein